VIGKLTTNLEIEKKTNLFYRSTAVPVNDCTDAGGRATQGAKAEARIRCVLQIKVFNCLIRVKILDSRLSRNDGEFA